MDQTGALACRTTGWSHLVRRCALRDESALAELYDESSRLVYTVALRILRHEDDAAEVVVDVYRQVWSGATRFDEQRGSVAAWLVILSRSRAMDRRRSRNARMRFETGEAESPDAAAPQPSPEKLAAASQSRRQLLEALAAVPLEQRQALDLAFFSGLTHSEIAERLGEPLGTVKTRIRLGVLKLRELLKSNI